MIESIVESISFYDKEEEREAKVSAMRFFKDDPHGLRECLEKISHTPDGEILMYCHQEDKKAYDFLTATIPSLTDKGMAAVKAYGWREVVANLRWQQKAYGDSAYDDDALEELGDIVDVIVYAMGLSRNRRKDLYKKARTAFLNIDTTVEFFKWFSSITENNKSWEPRISFEGFTEITSFKEIKNLGVAKGLCLDYKPAYCFSCQRGDTALLISDEGVVLFIDLKANKILEAKEAFNKQPRQEVIDRFYSVSGFNESLS